MRLKYHLLVSASVLQATASPIPTTPSTTDSSESEIIIHSHPTSTLKSNLANFAIAGGAATLLIGAGIGLSEWALHWYSHLLRDRQDRAQQNQTLVDERGRREEQWARREHGMNLVLEMAENYSEQIGSEETFDGNFEPLKVPNSIVGAVENVFEQTSDVENLGLSGGGRGMMDSLQGLKDALKPVLDFEQKEEKRKKRVGDRVKTGLEVDPPIPSIPLVPLAEMEGTQGSQTANHRFFTEYS